MKTILQRFVARFSMVLFFIVLITRFFISESKAQIPLAGKYTQNFNGLPTPGPFTVIQDPKSQNRGFVVNNSVNWENSNFLEGWYATMVTTTAPLPYSSSPYSVFEYNKYKYTPGNGMVGMGPEGDLSLGSYTAQENANLVTGNVYYGVRFKNNTAQTISFLELSFNLEQWLDADERNYLLLDYRVSSDPITDPKAGTWTNVGGTSLLLAPQDVVANSNNDNLTPLNGNVVFKPINVTIGQPGLTPPLLLLPGQEIMIRWTDLSATSNAGKKDILTIDDLVVIPFNDIGVPLPVEYTSFNAKAKNGKVELTWTTASEKDNDYFVVERSQNGKNFSAVGQVKGNGTSNIARRYTFTDENALTGANYYRLKQVDTDGKFEYSKVIHQGVAGQNNAATLQVAGNPFQSSLSFAVETSQAMEARVELRNMQGQVVHQAKQSIAGGSPQMQINTANLPQGVYILSVSGSDVHLSQRVLKIQ